MSIRLRLYADGTQKTELSGDGNSLDPVPAAEFLHHIIKMKTNGRFGDSCNFRDFQISIALSQRAQAIPFARRQPHSFRG